MKEVNDIKRFVLILSGGSILFLIGNLLFKFIGLYILEPEDYSIFSLTLQSFLLTIQIAGLQLHSPLTRELRVNKGSKEIIGSYAISYWITGVIGFIILLLIGNFFLTAFSLMQLILFSFTLVLFAFTELFLAIVRSKRYAIKSALITGIAGMSRGLIVIPFIFNIREMLTLNGFIYLYCMSLIVSFLLGAFFSKPAWKSLFDVLKKIRYRKELLDGYRNLKKGFLLSIHGVFLSLGNWVIILFGIRVFDPITFKIFDICFNIISIIWIFGVNLTISTFSVSNVEKQESKKPLFYLTLVGLIFTIGSFFIIELLQLDLFLLDLFNLTPTNEGLGIIRIAVFVPLPMLVMSFLNGKMQAIGRYKQIALASLLAFLGLYSTIIIVEMINIGSVLMLSLIFSNIIKIVFFYYYIYHRN